MAADDPTDDVPAHKLHSRFICEITPSLVCRIVHGEERMVATKVSLKSIVARVAPMLRQWIAELDPAESSRLRERIRKLFGRRARIDRDGDGGRVAWCELHNRITSLRRQLVRVSGEAALGEDRRPGKRSKSTAPAYKLIADGAVEICVELAEPGREHLREEFEDVYRALFREVYERAEANTETKWRHRHAPTYECVIADRMRRKVTAPRFVVGRGR